MMIAPSTSRFVYRPNGAYKLLVHILYGQYSNMDVGQRGIIELKSVRKLARLLGTQTATVNKHLAWLEDFGYIESLQYSQNRRTVKFRVRSPSNVI